ncbi:transcription termination/antitermination factor NusG [Candidatus Campbellbacteria bacterium]|nr:MAG: transcription termination/antitermination factor NusG [Candidatus Campbellbacteria bacterium]
MDNTQTKKQAGDGKRNWYAIYTNTGYENAVVKNLKQRIDSMNMQDYIFDAVVPTEKVTKIKNGKKVTEDVRLYPGYVMVDMIVNDESWGVVRNTPRVSGILGTDIHPVPITDEEMLAVVNKMKGDDTKIDDNLFKVGEFVKITEGPFKDTEGKILEINQKEGVLKLVISMFGKDTEMELSFSQVKYI